MNKTKAEKILAELNRRSNKIDLFSGPLSFLEQNNFIQDTSKLKALLTSRRGGKSYAAALTMVDECLKNQVTCAYIGLTRESAKNVIIPHLKEINKNFKVGAKFYKSPASVHFKNGSAILFFGINDTEEEREKLLGQHFKIAVIDEGASYTIDLKTTIKDFIQPTLWDDDGQLIIIGTPGNLRNYFCDITEGRVPGWSKHFWLTDKNPKTKSQYLKEIQEQRNLYPDIDKDPGFQQHYLAKWTIDTTKQAYKCTPKNYIDQLPPGKYRYLLGMDLGQEDDNAWVVGAYSEQDPTLYLVYSFSKNHMLMDEWIDKLKEIEQLYPISTWIIDSSNKQYVEELRYRTKRPFQNKPGGGQEKMKYVYMMNSDFIRQKIKIISTNCASLLKEYEYLTIDDSNPTKHKIVGGDHNADAALYLWRYSFHYNSETTIETIRTEEDKVEEFWQREADRLEKQKDQNFLERDWT